MREVVARYSPLEETNMELTISLPADYPLSVPKVESARLGLSQEMQRKWMLQMVTFLSNQVGHARRSPSFSAVHSVPFLCH